MKTWTHIARKDGKIIKTWYTHAIVKGKKVAVKTGSITVPSKQAKELGYV